MKQLLLFFFCSLHMVCSGQLLNGSFENWVFRPDAGDIEQRWALVDWQHLSPLGDFAVVGVLANNKRRSSMPN